MCKHTKTTCENSCPNCPLTEHIAETQASAQTLVIEPHAKREFVPRLLAVSIVALVSFSIVACSGAVKSSSILNLGSEAAVASDEQPVSEATGPTRGLEDQVADWQPTSDGDLIIEQVAASEYFAAFLAENPGWFAYVEPAGEEEDEGEGEAWFLEFLGGEDEEDEEFLGYAYLNSQTGLLYEWAISRPLSRAELEAGREEVRAVVAQDSEVQALLGDPASWQESIRHEPLEDGWIVEYRRGMEGIELVLFEDGGDLRIFEIYVDGQLDEEESEQYARATAIDLAANTEQADIRLENIDDWTTLAEPQADGLWTVTFLSEDETLLFAVVDVNNETVVEVQ